MTKIKKGVLNLLVFIAAMVGKTMWGAFVGMALWNWFIPGFIKGAPQMGWVQCMGVLLVCLFFFKVVPAEDKSDKSFSDKMMLGLISSFLIGVLLLLFGWIITLLM